MKKIIILRFFSILAITLLLLPFYFNALQTTFQGLENKYSINNLNVDIKSSKVWDLTKTPIYIKNNWATIALNNDWCNGSGTFSDPYVIENVIINGNDTTHCIKIINSDDYFVIKNCTLYNSFPFSGISLSNTKNGTITSNFFSNNKKAINLTNDCSNNTISGNKIENQGYGIHLSYSTKNFIDGNNISVNCVGINLLDYSYLNSISDNIIHTSGITGIYFHGYCNNNTISDNSIEDQSENGIYFYGLNEWNIISENEIKNCSMQGIYIQLTSKKNSILFNTISDCGLNGIYIYGPTCNSQKIIGNTLKNNKGSGLRINTGNAYSLMHNNSFIGNNVSAVDNGNDNDWDNGMIGNYWDDYKGNDTDDDGIGDIPYYVSGSAGSQDNYPIWDDGPDEISDDNGDNGDEDGNGNGGVISGYDLVFILDIALFAIIIAIIFKKKNFIK